MIILNRNIIKSSIVLFTLLLSCQQHRDESNKAIHEHEHSEGHKHTPDEHHKGHDHSAHIESDHHDNNKNELDEDGGIIIEPDKAKQLGIESIRVNEGSFTEAIKVSGEISSPPSSRRSIVAPTTGVLLLEPTVESGIKLQSGQVIGSIKGENISGGDIAESLLLDYQTAKSELDRITPLYEKGVVSKKDYNAVFTEVEKARLALGNQTTNTKGRLISPATGTLINLTAANGDYVTAGQTIGYIGDNVRLTLKADLPKRFHSKAHKITDAYIIPTCGDCEGFNVNKLNGKRVDGNISVTNNAGGILPIYFSFNNNGTIDSNGFVDVYLLLDTKKHSLSVPQSSIFEQQGEYFVYVQLDEDCYEKRAVRTGGSNGNETEIIQGLKDGENVVYKGVTFVKLAETAGMAPEGHSHSH